MSGRPAQILSRFPAHMEAGRPGKQLFAVVESLSLDQDALAQQLADVRRAHRLGHCDTLVDLLLIAGLHGLTRADLAVLFARADQVRALVAKLLAAPGNDAAEPIFDLMATDAPKPRLALYGAGAADASKALAAAAQATVSYRGVLEAARARVSTICRIHASGNGTVRALLEAAANALDLELDLAKNSVVKQAIADSGQEHGLNLGISDDLFHSDDRFRHASFVLDRMQPAPLPPAAPGGKPRPLPYAPEAVAMEENPKRRETRAVGPKAHAEPFTIIRRGFGHELLRADLKGIGTHTQHPMLVNRDQGHGVGLSLAVPDGKVAEFREDGHVTLDGADVTSYAYSWRGACFADAGTPSARDFVFAGDGAARYRATFAVATPTGALDRGFNFPHAGQPIEAPDVRVGITRLVLFVRQAHLSSLDGPQDVRWVVPRPFVAFADAAVFAGGDTSVKAADITLSWMENEGYAVRIVIPARFAALDEHGFSAKEQVAAALQRFRPAGVVVRVEYEDDRWVLGTGVVDVPAVDNPIDRLLGGTVLWPTPS
jgi:hypothetical protein